MRIARLFAVTVALVSGSGSLALRAQQNIDFATLQLQTVKITDGLFVLMGGPAQGNIAVSVGSDGVFLIDTMYGQMHQKIVDAVKALSPLPIRYVVNTHLHGDHTGGNAAMAALGATILSHANMRSRMAAAQPPLAPKRRRSRASRPRPPKPRFRPGALWRRRPSRRTNA